MPQIVEFLICGSLTLTALTICGFLIYDHYQGRRP